MSIEINKIYIIDHSRKGTFVAKILEDTGEWIKVEVVKGRAHFISLMNADRGAPQDVFQIRKKFCTFREYGESE